MLKKRNRASSSKQGLLMSSCEYPSSLPSTTARYSNRPTPSIFPSPSLLAGFADATEAVRSPTSTLEPRPFCNPFFTDRNTWQPMPTPSENKRPRPWDISGHSAPVGLGIVDALKDEDEKEDEEQEEEEEKESKSNSLRHDKNRKVLFGSQLKIQIPTLLLPPVSVHPNAPAQSPHSPMEFGIKTMNSVLASRSPGANSGNSHPGNRASPRICTGMIPADEMELSEDYTCVMTHGPNARTTHIFDNCIVESRGGDFFQTSSDANNNGLSTTAVAGLPSESFLSFCHTCKKDLRHGKDIYMYRGEKAFCSSECRYREILFDEGTEKCL